MESETPQIVPVDGEAIEAAAEAQAEAAAEVAEAATSAAVEIAEIEAGRDIALAEINAETRIAEAEALAEAVADEQEEVAWQRNIETELAETRQQLAAMGEALLLIRAQLETPPPPNPLPVSEGVPPEVAASQAEAPEPPAKPKKSRWI